MLSEVMSHAERALHAPNAEEASTIFFRSARRLGASYLQTRLYRRPTGMLTSASHFAAGGIVKRISPTSWQPGSAAFDYVCFDCNPLLAPIREGRTRYRFSDFAPRGERAFGKYWDALGEAGISEALCATSYGPDRAIASLHLGFPRADLLEEEDVRTVQLAGLLLTEHLLDFVQPSEERPVRLTDRERDCIAFVADGKTD